MGILEVGIFILSILMVVFLMYKKEVRKQYVISLLTLTILFITFHLIFGEIRWQLNTLYIAVIMLMIIVNFKSTFNNYFKNFVRRIIITVLSVLVVISMISAFVFPVFDMPKPNGEYLIGTESFVIEDNLRIEQYSGNANDFRKTKIQIWYPAESITGYELAPWLEDGKVVSSALAKDMGLPSFVLNHTVDVMSNSYVEAPISNALNNYPVVIISHGWRGFRNLHTDFAEELASQGYIVVGIDHSYGSVATVYEDDDIVLLNLEALPPRETTPDFLDYANQLVNTYASDITATLNYLEEINDSNSDSRFSEKFDLTQIGLLGHSTGGGADVAVALNDDRIDVVIGLDAWVEPIDDSEIDKGLTIPSLFLRSGTWEVGENNENLYQLINSSTYPSELYQIDGTTHYDFAMVYVYSPLTKYIDISGTVEGEYLNSILKSMISDFFNENLKNTENSEIESDSWEEVIVINTP